MPTDEVIGRRIEIHPAYGAWMADARRGMIIRRGRPTIGNAPSVWVKLDKLTELMRFRLEDLNFID